MFYIPYSFDITMWLLNSLISLPVLIVLGWLFGKFEGRIILPFRLCLWGLVWIISMLVLNMTSVCMCSAVFGWHHFYSFESAYASLHPIALTFVYLLSPFLVAYVLLPFWMAFGFAKAKCADGESKKTFWLYKIFALLKVFAIALCGSMLAAWMRQYHGADVYLASPHFVLALILISTIAAILWRKRFGIIFPIVLFAVLYFSNYEVKSMPRNSDRIANVFYIKDGKYDVPTDKYRYNQNDDPRDLESRNLRSIDTFFFARHNYLDDWNLEALKKANPQSWDVFTKESKDYQYLKAGDANFAEALETLKAYITLIDNSERTKKLLEFLDSPDLVLMGDKFAHKVYDSSRFKTCAFSDKTKAFYEIEISFKFDK